MKKFQKLWFILLTLVLSACQFPLITSRSTPFPTLFVPTPDCGSPTLVLGTTTFQIQNLTRAADGSLTLPADTSGVAYLLDGTNTNYVFVLSPANALVISAITVGSTAKVTLKNCNSTTFNLSAPEQGMLSALASIDQSTQGITIFLQTDASGAGAIYKGELAEQQISTFNTPVSNGSEIQADIGILETKTSSDGKTIQIGVSIYNWGQSPITLSTSDVTLTQSDDTTLTMISAKPSLPLVTRPTKTEKVTFTFPRPSSQTATLKVFTVEYDIEGY